MADENKKQSTDDLVKEHIANALDRYKEQYAKFAEERKKTVDKMASVICGYVCADAAARVIATALVDKGYGGNMEEFYTACLNYNTELLGKARTIEHLEWRVEQLSTELASETEEHRKFVCEVAEKIEQGTLIELPCNVGDTVYFIDEKRWVWEMVVVEIAILKKNIVCEIGNRRKEVRSVWKENWGKTIFFTREEAEKRLKELQNG